MGRAGAFTARADDLSAVIFNPAGLSHIQTTLLQGGNRFSYNAHAYTRAPTPDLGAVGMPPTVTFATVRNDQPWQLLEPLVGVASNLGLDGWGFALAAFGAPGVSEQRFPLDGGQRYMMVGREAQIINYSASVAWKHRDVFGLGLSLQWISVPKLTYQLVIDASPFGRPANPVSSDYDMLATVNGSDPFTLNAVFGAWYRPARFLELGVSAQVLPSEIRTDSELSVDLLAPSSGGVALTRDGVPANDVTLSVPLPMTARAGVRYRHLDGNQEVFDLELDVVYETWSRVREFLLDSDNLEATFTGQTVPVGEISIEKQWRDTVGVHLGGDYVVSPAVTVRAGVFYESAVAEPAYLHVDFASGQQLGGALGASVSAGPLEVAIAYEYRHQPTASVSEANARVYQEVPASSCEPPYTDPAFCHPQLIGQPSPKVNAGTYDAHSHVASVDLLYRF